MLFLTFKFFFLRYTKFAVRQCRYIGYLSFFFLSALHIAFFSIWLKSGLSRAVLQMWYDLLICSMIGLLNCAYNLQIHSFILSNLCTQYNNSFPCSLVNCAHKIIISALVIICSTSGLLFHKPINSHLKWLNATLQGLWECLYNSLTL